MTANADRLDRAATQKREHAANCLAEAAALRIIGTDRALVRAHDLERFASATEESADALVLAAQLERNRGQLAIGGN